MSRMELSVGYRRVLLNLIRQTYLARDQVAQELAATGGASTPVGETTDNELLLADLDQLIETVRSLAVSHGDAGMRDSIDQFAIGR